MADTSVNNTAILKAYGSCEEIHSRKISRLLLLYYTLGFFLRQRLADGLSLQFEQQRSPQVSRTLLGTLAILISLQSRWSQFVLQFLSCPSSLSKSLGMVLNASFTNGITVMFHSFLSSLVR